MKKVFWSFLFFFSIINFFTARSQQSLFTTYTVSDGLVNNAVRKIYQDSKGFLWLCTWEGLSKYDGHKFTNFTVANGLSHNLVNDVIELAPGELYVANNNGTMDIIKNDRVISRAIIKDVVINQLKIDRQGRVRALTDSNGIYELRKNKFYRPTQAFEFRSFFDLLELDSLLLIAGFPEPVVVYTKNYKYLSSIPGPGLTVWSLHKDKVGRILAGTNQGVKLLKKSPDFKNIEFATLPEPLNIPALTQPETRTIFEEKKGTLWFGTMRGLIKILPDGTSQKLTIKDGLPSDQIYTVFQDREENLWIGTSLGLVKAIRKFDAKFNSLSKSSPNELLTSAYPVNESKFLISSDNNIYRFETSDRKFHPILPQSIYDPFPVIQNTSPPLLISEGKIFVFDTLKNECRVVKALPSKEYTVAAAMLHDRIFLGSFKGLFMYANKQVIRIKEFPNRINNLLADKKNYLWIGSWHLGLHRVKYDLEGNLVENENLTALVGDKYIRMLYEDKAGNVWVGTRYNGVVRFSGSNLRDTLHFNQKAGLLSNWVRDADEDDEGNIWITTNGGINKLVKEATGYRVFNFSRVTNFFGEDFSIIHVDQKKLWCAFQQGVVEITNAKFDQLPPYTVYITKALLGTSNDNVAYHQNEIKPLQLSYTQNQAYFEFTSPTFLNEKEILYSYRLLGSGDTAWHSPSNIHTVQYASLQPGHYRFEVKMLGWNGDFGHVSSFSFIINPPFWNTWWFYLLVVAAMLSALSALYRYRMNQLLKLQQVRNRIATDLHDDIGSTLTNISILSELSRKNLQQPNLAERFLSRITEESAASQQAMDDIIWSVNTNNDNLVATVARMRRYASELFENSSTACHLDFETTDENMKLNMDQRRDIYLIFKECMNNIQKHANASNVYISINVINSFLHMKINDDGKGFDVNLSTDRNGLKNMQSRAAKWNGILKVSSKTGEGTSIFCKLPLH